MKNIFFGLLILTFGVLMLASCYNNKYDLMETSLPKVSFMKEVVPIMQSGACGCHNEIDRAKAGWVQFTDTTTGKPAIGVISARMDTIYKWAMGQAIHPAGGSVTLSERDKKIIIDWYQQGQVIDQSAGTIPDNVTFTKDILPITITTCKGGTCHGGSATVLTYTTLTKASNMSALTTMANTGGQQGHPGPNKTVTLDPTTAAIIGAWISQGTKQ